MDYAGINYHHLSKSVVVNRIYVVELSDDPRLTIDFMRQFDKYAIISTSHRASSLILN